MNQRDHPSIPPEHRPARMVLLPPKAPNEAIATLEEATLVDGRMHQLDSPTSLLRFSPLPVAITTNCLPLLVA